MSSQALVSLLTLSLSLSSVFPSLPLTHIHKNTHTHTLWADAACSQRKWCCPSGVVINMLNGEQVLGMGRIETSYTPDPQNNPGMYYNEENHFGEKCLERQQSCGKCFRDNRKAAFLHFHLDSFNNLGCKSSEGKSSIKCNFLNALPFSVKISGLDIYLSHFRCLSPWSTLTLKQMHPAWLYGAVVIYHWTAIKHPQTFINRPTLPLKIKWHNDDHFALTLAQAHIMSYSWLNVARAYRKGDMMKSYRMRLLVCRFMLIKWGNELNVVSRWVPGSAIINLVPPNHIAFMDRRWSKAWF